jgi:hypothetical protein
LSDGRLMPSLHPDLEPVAMLLGTWSGRGRGEYPTIESFDYDETITFGHVGKPFLVYGQRTRSVATPPAAPAPLHAETGYWRFPAPGRVEVVLSHPSGITEVEEGSIAHDGDRATIELATTHIGRTSTAKEVTALTRRLVIDGDTISYEVDMAAVGQPLQFHLAATLHRTD